MSFGGKSGPSGTTTSTANTSPWAPQQPYLQDIFQNAQSLYQNNAPQYYPSPTFAQPNSLQVEANAGIAGLARQGSPVTAPASATANSFLQGTKAAADPALAPLTGLANTNLGTPNAVTLAPYLSGKNIFDPYTSTLDPFLSGSRMAAGNPNETALVNSIFADVQPRIQSQFIAGGALNSPEAARATSAGITNALAQPLFNQYQNEATNALAAQNQAAGQYFQGTGNQLTAQNQAADQALRAMGAQTTAATGLQGAYGQNAQQMLGALALAPSIQAMPYTDLSQLAGVGANVQQNDQQIINDAVQRYNYGQTLPFNQLNQYIGQVTGNYGGTTTATQPYFNNQSANLLGGALGGASLGSSILPSLLGTSAGASSGIGAGLGGLLTLLAGSDRRMKEDIQQIDTLDNGLPLYAFRYIGDPMIHIGLMADEVVRVHPEAVIVGISGLAMVDYRKAMS